MNINNIAWLSALLVTTTQSASFECSSISSFVETVICESSKVSKLDDEMAKLYFSQKKKLSGNEKIKFVQSQRRFIKHRNNCKNNKDSIPYIREVFKVESCLVSSYKERVTELINRDNTTNESSVTQKYSQPNISDCPNIADVEFISINGGSFMMGTDRGYYSDESPSHSVTIKKFCVAKQPYKHDMSYVKAMKLVKKLSSISNAKIRLITEAEWEYVALHDDFGVKWLMSDWELRSSIYTKYPYRIDDGRENQKASNVYRVLRGGSPYDPALDYQPQVTLRGYASIESAYKIRLAADVQ